MTIKKTPLFDIPLKNSSAKVFSSLERLVNIRAKESDIIIDSIKADGNIMITSAEKQSDEIKKEILDVMNEYMSYYSSK